MKMNLCFFYLVLKQVNAVVVVIILTIHMKKFVSDVVKNLNVKVFNLFNRMHLTNKTRFIKWHETCKCECKFEANVCNTGIKINADVNAKK